MFLDNIDKEVYKMHSILQVEEAQNYSVQQKYAKEFIGIKEFVANG